MVTSLPGTCLLQWHCWPAGFTHLTSENHVELRGLVWLLAEEWGPGFPGKVPALPRRPRCDQLLVPWEHEVS